MPANHEGIVAVKSERAWRNKDGEDITLRSFKLDGTETWFRTGTDAIPAEEGDTVRFSATGQQVDLTTFETVAKGEAPAKPKAAPTAKKQAYTNPRDDYWKEKDRYDKEVRQKLIGFQSARADATRIITAALANDALALGQKKADRLGIIMGMVEQTTEQLFAIYLEKENELNAD